MEHNFNSNFSNSNSNSNSSNFVPSNPPPTPPTPHAATPRIPVSDSLYSTLYRYRVMVFWLYVLQHVAPHLLTKLPGCILYFSLVIELLFLKHSVNIRCELFHVFVVDHVIRLYEYSLNIAEYSGFDPNVSSIFISKNYSSFHFAWMMIPVASIKRSVDCPRRESNPGPYHFQIWRSEIAGFIQVIRSSSELQGRWSELKHSKWDYIWRG